ncbi:MAG TPA: phospholipase D-like domain-containing protein [Bryobacteraceae bacterium]|nr:phospholipase D-like domain-containing protein [Bryobacteraceae bacterium]
MARLGTKNRSSSQQKHHDYRALTIISMIALVLQSGLIFLALFEPILPYQLEKPPDGNLASDQFVRTLQALSGGQLHRQSKFEVLTNGASYYPAELAAIRAAQQSVNIEAYIFEEGEMAAQFREALTERARAGVKVHLLMDAIGSASTKAATMKALQDAGGRVDWYNRLRWYTWPRINNRTHRELMIIDGNVGFIGGAGVADHWFKPVDGKPSWRDTMVRVEGEAAAGLQGVFAENWLESSGEVLTGREYFPFSTAANTAISLVVGSAPTTGQSTSARVLFQTLLASARQRIYVTTPYFLPDASIRKEMVRAIKERHVEIRIIVPGKGNDHTLTRRSSRRLYGELLQAGAKIYEYGPAMIHTKGLVVDSLWSVVGSTNLDSRSFGINDEVNIALLDAGIARRLEQDFETDVKSSQEISYQQWKNRSVFERGHEWLGAVLERQQ